MYKQVPNQIEQSFRLYGNVVKIIIFAGFHYLHCARIHVLISISLFNPKSILITHMQFDSDKQPLFATKSKKTNIISVLPIVI